ncbi:hypothetical protein [Spiroplasma poulsonii]|uniref:hypothetical protein n=1 Tax=Spiroplasma poulsonii TaxID=2138 RepID=UPI001F4CD6A2|nr:hypothetical protein [Spiroplasma poulsonii]UNF62432.1 hypothetical protein MNU24_02905 [Spiroplasma poulsonii]
MKTRYGKDMTLNKIKEGIVITDPANTSSSNSSVGRNIHTEDKNSKFYWSKDWKITPPAKLVQLIISLVMQASSYFRRKDEFGNTVGQVQIEYNKMGACNVWDILNMNNFINRQITVLPLNYTQKLVFNPFTIPGGKLVPLKFYFIWYSMGWVINQMKNHDLIFTDLMVLWSSNVYSFIMMPFIRKLKR